MWLADDFGITTPINKKSLQDNMARILKERGPGFFDDAYTLGMRPLSNRGPSRKDALRFAAELEQRRQNR